MLFLLAVLGGCIAALQLLLQLYRHVKSPLKSVPGPLFARFTDLWYFWKLRQGSFEKVNKELHEKYGPVVRYGPNRYSIDDQAAIKIIYGHGTQFEKSSWYDAWSNPGTWNIFAERNIQVHAQHRRQYQNAYSMSSLVEYEPFMDECADIFSQRLAEFSQSGLPVNMGHWMQCYAFDVIGCITYSKRLGFLDQGEDIGGIMAALENFLRHSAPIGVYPFLHPYLFQLNTLIAASGKGRGISYVVNYTMDRMAEHQASAKALDNNEKGVPGKARDFLSKFVARHMQEPDTFTTYHILHGCANNMIAGSDTTAISLSAILYYLLRNPRCYAKLREEIAGSEKAGEASRFISFKQSQEMPYLQAVIKEALRLHPATGLPLERMVPPGGATIAGQFFPEGSVVGVNTWVEHRNTHVFGKDASEFRPERWLSDDAETIAFMNRHWMPFGLGSRTCIGRHVSHLEISKLIPQLVRDFDFELSGNLANNGTSWSADNYWFVKPKNFMVRIKSRKDL
ncbi:cytochrome P450 [Hypoxylon sp. FL0543]|nr:cytochrome P450 [Hypoxylon sp. FL0543]